MENCHRCSWPGPDAEAENLGDFFVPWPIEDRATAVSKSHSQAEKRRRDRINAQLSALRKLIPKSDKMDKAGLLGSAIEHVKDLKRKAAQVSKAYSIPTEVDEVSVDCESKQDNKMLIRASICCDDRPQVFGELIPVLKALRLSTVKADISSVGGRLKTNLILLCSNNEHHTVSPTTLKQSLNVVLNRIASSSAAPNCRIRSKRQRLFFPCQFTQ